jgi:hypothetical protein
MVSGGEFWPSRQELFRSLKEVARTWLALELVQHGFMEAFADAVGLRAFGYGAGVVARCKLSLAAWSWHQEKSLSNNSLRAFFPARLAAAIVSKLAGDDFIGLAVPAR